MLFADQNNLTIKLIKFYFYYKQVEIIGRVFWVCWSLSNFNAASANVGLPLLFAFTSTTGSSIVRAVLTTIRAFVTLTT